MLYFIDQTSEKDHHMVFNSSIIKILMLLYPNQKLTYSGINSNQESVLSLLTTAEKDRIILAPIIYSKPLNDNRFFKIINFYRKEKLRAKSIKQIFNATTTNDLVFLSITTFSSFYFFKKTKAKYPVKTIVTLHGDVDFIYNSYNYYEKLNAFFHKKIFKTKAQNFYYLLLNKIAKQRLVVLVTIKTVVSQKTSKKESCHVQHAKYIFLININVLCQHPRISCSWRLWPR